MTVPVRDVLGPIVESTRRDIAELARDQSGSPSPRGATSPHDVAALLRRGSLDEPLRLIAEIKRRSPSAGLLSTALSVGERARAYEASGASMLSVLVDREHFGGSYADLAAARAAVRVPLLCKGFILDRVQVEAAARAGADAVLLIVRILDDATLRALFRAIVERSMTPIVEVVTPDELERARAVGAQVIGVNARDLSTLEMDAARADRLLRALPSDAIALHFSGLRAPADVAALAAWQGANGRRIDGALIGEALMRLDDPRALLRSLVDAGGGARRTMLERMLERTTP